MLTFPEYTHDGAVVAAAAAAVVTVASADAEADVADE